MYTFALIPSLPFRACVVYGWSLGQTIHFCRKRAVVCSSSLMILKFKTSKSAEFNGWFGI